MNHDRKTSLQVVLQKCIAWDEEFRDSLVKYMFEQVLISEDEKNQIDDLPEENQIGQITKLITDTVFANKTNFQKLKDFFDDSDVDATVISLISLIVDVDLSKSLLLLIEKWDKLVELEKELKEDIVNLDPNYRNLDNSWPLNFIQFCAKSENQDFLEDLYNNGKIFRELCSTPKEVEITNEVRHADGVSDKEDPDGGLESFDYITEADISGYERNVSVHGATLSQELCSTPKEVEPDEFGESPPSDEECESSSDENEKGQLVTDTEIEKIGNVLQLIVKLLWPKDEELIKAENWPTRLVAMISDNETPELCSQFANAVKFLLKLKEEYGSLADFSSLPRLDVESAKVWISECSADFSRFNKGLDVFNMLYQMAWPKVEQNQTESLEAELLEKYNLDSEKTTDFVNAAQVFHRFLQRVDVVNDQADIPLDEEEKVDLAGITTVSSESCSDDDDDDDYQDIVENLLRDARNLLLPFVKVAWPEKFKSFNDEDWNTHLVAILGDNDNSQLCQNFIELCRQISELRKENTDFKIPSSLSCDSSEEWISSASANLFITEKRKLVFSILFQLTWPELEPFSSEISPTTVLSEQYNKNKERATDFVNAAVVLLGLLEESERKNGFVEPSEDLNKELSFLESKHEEIAQSRPVLLPFVKLFWPENARILEEEKWPGELITFASKFEGSSTHECSFIDICRDVLELRKGIQYAAWPSSVNAKAARDWIITISDQIELLGEWSSRIGLLFRVIWPELDNLPVHGWTRALLEKHKSDELQTRSFVNAAQMLSVLLKKTQALKTDDTGKGTSGPSGTDVKGNSTKTTFLKDNYDEIVHAKDILLPIINLVYSQKITEDESWPNELIATVVEDDNAKQSQIFITAMRQILKMKKAVPDFRMKKEELDQKNVCSWISRKVSTLNKLDEKTHFFHCLFLLAFPNGNQDKIKALEVSEFYKDDSEKVVSFAHAIGLFLPLRKKFEKLRKSAHKEKKRSEAEDCSSAHAQSRSLTVSPNPETADKYLSHVQSTSLTVSPVKAEAKPRYVKKKSMEQVLISKDEDHHSLQIQSRIPTASPMKAVERPPCPKNESLEQVLSPKAEDHYPLQVQTRSSTAPSDPDAEDHYPLRVQSKNSTASSGPEAEDYHSLPDQTSSTTVSPAFHTEIQKHLQENYFHLQVSVPNMLSDIHVIINDERIKLDYCRDLGRGNIYGKMLPWRQTFTYTYEGLIRKHWCCEKIQARRYVYKPDSFIYDAAAWENSNYSWDELMKYHLPFTCYSVDIMNLVLSWLRQMHMGWKFCNGNSHRITEKKTEKHIILWLQSLTQQNRLFGALSILLAMKHLKYKIKDDMSRDLLKGMQIDFLEATQHEKLYNDILSEFVVGFKSTSDISKCMLEVLNELSDREPTFLLVLPLYLLVKYGHEGIIQTSEVFGKQTVLPFSKGEEELLKDLEIKPITEAKFLEKNYQKHLISLQKVILSTHNTTPWIVVPYQRLLTLQSVIKLLDTGIVKFFRLDCLLEDVLAHVDKKESKDSAAILTKIKEHFIKMFQNAGIVARQFSEDEAMRSLQMMINMSTALLKAIKKNKFDKSFVFFCVQLTYSIADWSSVLTQQSRQTIPTTIFEKIRGILDCIWKNLSKITGTFEKNDIKACSRLLEFPFDTVLQCDWTQNILDGVTALIEHTWDDEHDEDYLEFFSKGIMQLDIRENLMNCFNEKAFQCAKRLIYADKISSSFFCFTFGRNISTTKMAVFEKLFLDAIQRFENIREQNETQQILKFICEWPMTTRFFHVFSKPTALEYLPQAKVKVQKIVKVCSEFVRSLYNETTAVENLKIFCNIENRKKVCEFLEFMQQSKPKTSQDSRTDSLESIVCSFLHRISRFESEKEEVLVFFGMCNCVEDIGVHITCEEMKCLYSTMKPKSVKSIKANTGERCGLSKQDLDEFRLMKILKGSNAMLSIWKNVTKKCKMEKNFQDDALFILPWKAALTLIWKKVRIELCDLATSIIEGTIAINDVAEMFEPVASSREALSQELKNLFCFYSAAKNAENHEIPLPDIADRVYDVFEISKNSAALRWVLKFKEIQELNCDFEPLESIINTGKNTEMTLNDIDKDTLKKFPDELRKMTNWNLDILQHFLNQKELIAWLKTTNMTDVSEMKVMCDLILASAGETPIETDRVMHLLNATQCFAPLLFYLDEVKSLGSLQKRCCEVWSNVKRDSKILQKWKDSGSQVRWLSEKLSLYGSEQKNSLVCAQEINERGVYTVGRLTEKHPTLGNSVLLTLRSNELESPQRGEVTDRFTLDELQDLQSKLALLAGEGDQSQQDIAQFVDLFSTVKTLAEAFVNLTEAGCMLFSDWKAIITSSPRKTIDRQNENNLTLTIQFMEENQNEESECKQNATLHGGTASLSVLQDLSRTLRLTSKQWIEYISSKRLQHYYLNEYSMQQITYLCQQLATTSNIASLPDQVLTLLSNNSKNLVAKELQDALDEATKIDNTIDYNPDIGSENMEENERPMSELEKKKRAIRILVNNEDIDENLAKAAVQANGYESIDDCITWAMLHEFEDEVIEEHLKKYYEENAYAFELKEEEEMTSILQNRSIYSLTEMIAQILNESQNEEAIKIVGAVKTICSRYFEKTSTLTMRDYLSVEHLGKFLSILGGRGKLRTIVHRDIVSSLQSGKPNVIICSEAETLTLLLSIYMTNPQQPLPTTSEVLLCCEETSEDEVERFMHRAMCKSRTNGKPLFCMAFTDKLKFRTSKALEEVFEKLQQQQQHLDEQYQLIFLTSNTQHYISECFDKYHVQKKPDHKDKDDILDYLLQHLSSDEIMTDRKNSSLVRLVVSNRSGVGKSLYVKKLFNQIDRRWYEETEQTSLMQSFIKVLNRPEMPFVNREFPKPLKKGKANFVHCSQNDSLNVLLGIYMNNTKEPHPTTWEVLVGCKQTTAEEVEQFFRRAMFEMQLTKKGKQKCIFALAFGEQLRPKVAQEIKEIHKKLSGNIHCKKDYSLVIVHGDMQYFDWCEKFIPTRNSLDGDEQSLLAYLLGEDVPEGNKLQLENIDQTVGQDAMSFTENISLSSDFKSPVIWRKTTIRLLEKSIDTNHALEQLYREDHFRNEDSHFIHIDLTPAVEDGIERFMFNLLILGSIQDSKGRVWNRQKQHIYVVEMTKSLIKKDQIHENSILNILPHMTCLPPQETLQKLKNVKLRTRNILKTHLIQPQEGVSYEIDMLRGCLEGDEKHFPSEFLHVWNDTTSSNDCVVDLLKLSGIPIQATQQVIHLLTDKLRELLTNIYVEEKLHTLFLMDYETFISTTFQRPYQYLKHASLRDIKLDDFQYSQPGGTQEDCLNVLLENYVSPDPNWAQIKHFASFLNVQLENCEECVFCQKITGGETGAYRDIEGLTGLKDFAVNFMIRMSQDFATPSLVIADQSGQDSLDYGSNTRVEHDVIDAHQLRRKWEEKCHPYVFFNEDRSMSFINVDINSHGDLLDVDGNVLVEKVADKNLVRGLKANHVEFGFNFHKKSRMEKLSTLRTIMGLPDSKHDPDYTYELTTDNVLKILAIYMRLRCGIPVIVMGETGCGKTRMVEFMSKLRAGNNQDARNMVTLKIHGGVNAGDIYKSVEKAASIANLNAIGNMDTVLFYDEANTTRAIYAIKEVVCDNTINGVSFHDKHLQIVAACNPYKRLSDKAITTLENSGLGYRVSALQTTDCLGEIPMRRLVYKVVALPPSMQPFVWDFGQLSAEIEKKYIHQMTLHLQKDLDLSASDKELVDFVFCSAQMYMKEKTKEECRYVSLRDVERCMKVFCFFHGLADFLLEKIGNNLDVETERVAFSQMRNTLLCLIQTIGVCYHVSLDAGRAHFRQHMSKSLLKLNVNISASALNNHFVACQKVFLRNISLDRTIAPNEALRENVYLISICCQLQIPLFVVGKPGSSKSLAKTIVADNMRGKNSYSALFRKMKQIYTVSYQCSALTNAAGIETVFRQCADFQKKEHISTFSAVVVLDEIGLAEDSPNMPLKVLHPLLECGSTESGTISNLEPKQKVGFVGISNWALDPAKMNRGIFVTRSTPNEEDLLATAKSIMKKETRLMEEEQDILKSLTKAYLDIYNDSLGGQATKEYFGLRDYYSLIKMINLKSVMKEKFEFKDVAYAAQRNFSGGHESHFEQFTSAVQPHYEDEVPQKATIKDIIEDNLSEQNSRFLLLLTGQHSSVSLLQHLIPEFRKNIQVIFGSSFPGDHTYTEICKNINRIKTCMESGRNVVLLNLTEIHESLYDALNQHYMMYGGQRYVDIGLGSHRIKCRVSDDFRLIVMEHKDKVYREYPIPLINRLEKHHLTPQCLLSENQQKLSDKLSVWCKKYSANNIFTEKDAFVGYHSDTPSSVILAQNAKTGLTTCKSVLLQSATSDTVYRALKHASSPEESKKLLKVYTENQVHDNLLNLLKMTLSKCEEMLSLMTVTSFSSILTENDRRKMEECLNLSENSIMLMSLQQFDTQQEYLSRLESFFNDTGDGTHSRKKILLIQCSQAERHGPLLACAKYCVMNMLKNLPEKYDKTIIAFLLSTRRQHGFVTDCHEQLLLQHTETSDIIYVDDLRPTGDTNAVVSKFYGKTLTDILEIGSDEIKMKSGRGKQFLVLLKESVCQAMAKLKRQKVMDDRYIKCIDRLTKLFDLDDEYRHRFCFILSVHMKHIYLQRNEDLGDLVDDWKVKEACSAENLQEGGTFGKTLLLCLKRHLADLLAFIVSRIDENNNLEVLYKYTSQLPSSTWEVELWLKLFKLYEMEWKNMKSLKEFFVQFNTHLTKSFSPCFPFSFKLNSFFDAQWSINEDKSQDERSIFSQFEARLESTIIMHFYEEFEDEMVDAYATDLIKCNFDSDETLKFLTKVLLSISRKLKVELTQEREYENVRGIAVVYYSFRLYNSHLRMLHEIFKTWPEIIENVDDWITQQESDTEFIIHALAMKYLLELVRKCSIEDNSSCLRWLNLTSKCKKIFLQNIDRIAQPYHNEIRQIWDPISLLDSFLLQLLPGSEEKTFENYVKVVVNHSKRLHKPLQSVGFRDEKFLKILLNVLRKSFEDVELKLLISWQDHTCRMCRKKLSTPVKLPCGHFICKECMKNMLAAAEMRRQCPLCPTSIPQDFISTPASLSTEATNQLKKFKFNCTSFFLEYLEKFCFDGNKERSHERMWLIFEEFVIGVKDERPKLETRAIDMNISTRSCVLQCLLRKDEEYMSRVINDLLQYASHSGKGSQRENLILIILVGYEGSLHELGTQKTFKKALENVKREKGITLKMLSDVAKLRYTLQRYIRENCEQWQVPEGTQCELDSELIAIVRLCNNDASNTLKNFAVKSGCQQFGMSWLNFVLHDKCLEDLVTKELADETNDKLVDHFFLLGQDYVDIRAALDRGSPEVFEQQTADCFLERESFHKIISKILAAVKFPDDLRRMLHQIDNGSKYEWLYAITNFFNKENYTMHKKQNHEVKELVFLTGCLALCQPLLLHGFSLLAIAPSKCERLFLPAMPRSLFFSFQNALQRETTIAMYTCPNGHPYVIGECTKPWRESHCPECGEVIGGRLHVVAENNQRIEVTEETDLGYQLNAAEQLGKDDPCDRMSKQGVAVVHCILHCCMLIGLEHDSKTICRMLNKESKKDSERYLCIKIWENVLDLSNAIGRNCDEAVLIMHSCLNYILLNGADTKEAEIDWSTMENCSTWEVQFRRLYLLPVFQDLDSILAEAQQKLNACKDFGNSRLFRLTYEIASEEPPREYTWSHPVLWRTIKHSNAAHLLQFIGDFSSDESVLKVILDTPGLEYLQYLENVLKLQRIFISKYQNTIDLKQAEEKTFSEYMEEREGFKNRELVTEYIKIWNMIIRKGFPQSDLSKEYLQSIDEKSPVAMALPSSRGRGKCAKLLAERLIDIHNNFLEKCFSITKISNGSNEVDVVQLLGANHFICIDKKKDLLPLIRMHTAYTIIDGDATNFGPQHKITYNVDALEKQIREKYVAYKPLINKKSLPCITYPQDIGIGTDWNRVNDNIPQEPLPSKLIQEVDALMADRNTTPADICEGVRTLTHAISFLARIKTEASKTLQEYLKDNLLLSSTHMAMIPRSALISQTLALYQRLMWRKAVNFVQQGLNPYEEALSKADQVDIQDHDVLERLKDAFEHMDMNQFQQRLNEILIQVPDYNPNWSLTEHIFPNVEFIEENTPAWYERIPEEICFKHISHLFQLAVKGVPTTN